MIRVSPTMLAIFTIFATAAWSQEAGIAEDLQQGHSLAKIICSNCHVASPDQEFEPILRPPAPSFESIAQRDGINADTIRTFLTTTHRNINSGTGMPNPQLLDFQIRQLAVYLMSLRKQSKAEAGRCGAEIGRLETVLSRARANKAIVGTAPESASARLHRQPTPKTVARAEAEAQKKIEAALAAARKLNSEGKDAECIAMLKDVALPLGVH